MTTGPVTGEMALEGVRELLGRRGMDAPVRLDTRLEELGLDSTDVVELFSDLEDRAGVALDLDSAMDVETIGDLLALARVS